jgi:hypothetical protein
MFASSQAYRQQTRVLFSHHAANVDAHISSSDRDAFVVNKYVRRTYVTPLDGAAQTALKLSALGGARSLVRSIPFCALLAKCSSLLIYGFPFGTDS